MVQAPIRWVTTCSLLLLFAVGTECTTAQSRNPLLSGGEQQEQQHGEPLFGYERVGLYGGVNFGYQGLSDGVVTWLPTPDFPRNSPLGIGSMVGISYVRLMPNFFVTRPANDDDRFDPLRLYRRITTFELRLLYLKLAGATVGTGRYEDERIGSELLRHSLESSVEVVALEPRFSFDVTPMRNRSGAAINLGASFGYITNALLRSEFSFVDPSEEAQPPQPQSSSGRVETRNFYAALLFGLSLRVGFGKYGDGYPEIVPEADLMIPLTSIAATEDWLPFGIRVGVGLRWPL